MLNLELKAHSLTVFVADELEGHIPRRAGKIVAGTVEINGGQQFIASAHTETNMFFLQHVRSVHRCHRARVKERCGIPHAAGFEQRKFLQMVLLEVGHIDARIEFETGNKILRLQTASCRGGKLFAEVGKVRASHAQSGSHVVSAEWSEQLGAVTERFDQGKRIDAASAAVSVARAIEPDDNGRPVVFAAET